MNSAVAEVEAYLRRLDRESRWLPRAQATELHEQIAAHLADTLPADADTATAETVLSQLGDPRALVEQASGEQRRLRTRVGRVRWWTWTIIVVVVGAITAAAAVATIAARSRNAAAHARSLECSCAETFIYRADRKAEHDSDLGGVDVMQVPARSSRQGFEFDVANFSKLPQTILGFPENYGIWGDQPGVYSLSIGTRDEHGAQLTDTTFTTAPVTIPPGGNRAVKIVWNHLDCSGPRVQEILSEVWLRTRVGSLTRVEHIHLSSRIVITVPSPVAHPAPDSCQATRQAHR